MRAVAWIAFLLVGALVPIPVHAQATATPVLTWEGSEGPLVIEPLEQTDHEATLHVSCASGSAASPQPWTIQIGTQPVKGFTISNHPVSFHVVADPVACASGEVLASEPVVFSINVHHEVASGTSTEIVLEAKEQSQDEATTHPLAVEVGPYFNYQLRLHTAIYKVQPGEAVRLDVVGSNFGNADVRVTPTIGEGTSSDLTPEWQDGWVLPVGQDESAFAVTVGTGGGDGFYENRRDTVVLDFEAAWTEDPSAKGDPIQLVAVIQQKGSPALESPAPAAPALALFALAAFVVLRRRR